MLNGYDNNKGWNCPFSVSELSAILLSSHSNFMCRQNETAVGSRSIYKSWPLFRAENS